MICQVCHAELESSASVCESCGTIVGAANEKTLIAAGFQRDTVGGPPRGNVLAERYEVTARLTTDAMASRYRAIDQETENSVLVTVMNPELFRSNQERDEFLTRIEPEVGRGGAYMPGLLDADRDGNFVFAVEPFVAGPTLREVLDARRARGEAMEPAEVLPVAAQLQAALASVNGSLPHGDVRAERVVVSKEGVRLVAPFVVAALPRLAVADILGRAAALRAVTAPEVMKAGTSAASDRFGVAAIVVEALTRKPPSGVLPVLSGSLARIGEEVRALLALDPASRPTNLFALIESIAHAANTTPPRFEPASFKRPRVARRYGSRPDVTPTANLAEIPAFDDEITSEKVALSKQLASTSDATGARFPIHDPVTIPEPTRFDSERPGSEGPDTQKYPILRDSKNPPPLVDEDLDPRLVRAALGVTMDDLAADDDEEFDVAGLETVEDRVNGDETQPMEVIDSDVRVDPRPPPARIMTPVPPRLRKSNVPTTAVERSLMPMPRPSPLPGSARGSVPPPPPRRNSAPPPPRVPNSALQTYNALASESGPPPTASIATRNAEPTDLVRHETDADRLTYPPDPNAMTMKPQPARPLMGIWILGAVLLGVIIVASAILFRKHRDKELHERQLRERFNTTQTSMENE